MRYRANDFSVPTNVVKSPSVDINGFDWMAQQNGGQFDPVLFGDYRDPQDNILNNSFGDFFNEAFPLNDFNTPFNASDTLSQQPPKKDFMKEIEVSQNNNPQQEEQDKKQFINCDKLWFVPRLRTSKSAVN
jgi:AP-1-like transcription factor